jgi:two-component system LytT family sensor kinase
VTDAAPARLWPVILTGCLVVGALDAFGTAMQGVIGYEDRISWPTVVFQGSEWIFLGILTPITYNLGRKFPLRRRHLGRTIAMHAAGALLLCFGWALLGVLARQALGIGWDMGLGGELRAWTLISLPWSFFMYFALLGTFHAFTYYREVRQRELQTSQLAGQLADARLRALRAQLQPHFLFNALNAITVLVRDRREAPALRMLDQLSEMLRQVLRADRPHEIPLREELQLVQQYLAIEQVRFADRLRINYQIDDATLSVAVPSFVLQPLIENALRHGLMDRLDDAVLEIGARRDGDVLELWVRDNGRGLTPERAEGIGLENTRERLTTLYGAAASLTLETHPEGGTVARIRIPWRLL